MKPLKNIFIFCLLLLLSCDQPTLTKTILGFYKERNKMILLTIQSLLLTKTMAGFVDIVEQLKILSTVEILGTHSKVAYLQIFGIYPLLIINKDGFAEII